MLQVVNVSKSYGFEVILEEVSFVVNPGERGGLFGPNGSGKSTLLRIIAGEEQADTRQVILGSGASAAWLPQGYEVDSAQTLGEAVRRGLAEHTRAQDKLLTIEENMAHATGPELDALIEEYGRTSDEFAVLGGHDVEQRTAAVLPLGLGAIPCRMELDRRSGPEPTIPPCGLASLNWYNPNATKTPFPLLSKPTVGQLRIGPGQTHLNQNS